MKKIYVYDLECYYNIFTATFIDKDSDETRVFVIYKDRDDRHALFKFLDNEVQGLIGYNCLRYDSQLLEFLYRNKTATTQELRNYSNIIVNSESDNNSDVPEWRLKIPHLDLFKIHHFDNKNRRVALKWCEFGLDMPNIEDNPDDDNVDFVTSVLNYNYNDVISTKKLYEFSKDMIQLRKVLTQRYGLNFMNSSNSRIGSELCLELYCNATQKYKKDVKALRTYNNEIVIKDLLFNYIRFNTESFQNVHKYFKSLTVNTTKEINYTIKIKGIEYVYGSGGIHASVDSKMYESINDYIILDCDAASLYPSIATVNSLYPKHLGEEFSRVYKHDIVDVRLKEKAKGKLGDKAIIEGFKEAANSVYGKSNESTSWLFDNSYTLATTCNGQLLISMLIEMLFEIPNVQLIQANTDGITLYLHKNYETQYYDICNKWMSITKLTLEYAYYQKMIVRDVNNYIAQYSNSTKYKCKGAFEFENIPLHKNKSFSIIPRAVFNYFIHGIPVENTIYNHKNIYDFCAGVRAKSSEIRGASKYVLYTLENQEIKETKLSKTVRYFISKRGGTLYKLYANGTREHVEAPLQKGRQKRNWKVTIFNRYYESDNYDIDFQYYTYKSHELINSITIPNQLQLL